MRSKQQPRPSYRRTGNATSENETQDAPAPAQDDCDGAASPAASSPPSSLSPSSASDSSASPSASPSAAEETNKRIIPPPGGGSSSPCHAIDGNSEWINPKPEQQGDRTHCQPPVTGTTGHSVEQQLPTAAAASAGGSFSIHPNQLISPAPVTAASTATTMASAVTLNCSRNDNDNENSISVNVTNASAAVAHENGCITSESTARTTPITGGSRIPPPPPPPSPSPPTPPALLLLPPTPPSNLIDSHDDDDGDGDGADSSPPAPAAADGDDVTFNRRGVAPPTLPTTTSSNGNRNNFGQQGNGDGHHQDDDDDERHRELASPRCQSRDSTGSTGGGRCQSDDSNCSGNGSNAAPTPTPNSPPVGMPLPATLPPSAAAALLPPQSAAMAAYLNVAAAAAQQNRLLLSNPLASLAAQQVAQSPSPRLQSMQSPSMDDSPALDFSTKRSRRDSDADSCKDDNDAVNLSNKSDGGAESPSSSADVNSPLDLSVGGRKRSTDDEAPLPRKIQRPNDFKPLPATWVPPMNPYLAAVAAASMSPKNSLPLEWNGKNKTATNEATKALEKMSEMTRLGGSDAGDMRSPAQPPSGAGTGRHSAWQSHWLNKGADAVKDVFKCVWCKQSFPTLATLTTHMKETQHCGVNVPPSQQSHHEQHHRHQPPVSSASSNANSSSSASSKSDLNLLIKETMPLPRKLVRGQDVWLGKGAEQTRQILKCMWCGQSFRSLAEMTNHMQQTQHYTNIISQEQIISWKSSDEKGSSGPSSGPAATGPPTPMSGPPPGPQPGPPPATNSTVSAVLTCKVCDQAFSSLKDLSNHMIKNAHYKEHIMRSITETGGRRRQTREKRKKSLPVRKLLELERAAGQQDYKNGDPFKQQLAVSTKITCEKCGDKIETALFVDHIRQCVGGAIANASPRSIKNSIIPPDGSLTSPPTPSGSRDGLKSVSPASTSSTNRHISPHLPSPTPKDAPMGQGEKNSSSPSVLNAIEQLIEKSFDTRSRHGAAQYASNNASTPLGASILKRLGIDESVDYTKPLMDAQTMGLLRSYHQHQQAQYGRRERSGSESSSVSDRCSSRMESLTPERKPEISTPLPPSTPRRTPDKVPHSPCTDMEPKDFKVKNEPADEDEEEPERHSKISVKKEFNMEHSSDGGGGELDLRKNRTPCSSAAPSPIPSPASSDRSSAGCGEKKLHGSSLTALSSMFDSLNSQTAPPSANDAPSGGKKSSSANPLAALQKLCEKTDNPPAANTRLSSSAGHPHTHPHPNGGLTGANTPSGMVAFSWACNDAVITSDSVIKCAFCDTPFCSKGAYRHHLSKVHFVKDDASMEPLLQSSKALHSGASSSSSSSSAASQPPQSPKARSPASAPPPPPPAAQSPASSAADESVQSKFLKYTELAKQLSSKYV